MGLGEPWGDLITVNMLDMLVNTANITYQNPLWSTFLFRSLVANEGFKTQFKTRYNEYLNGTFETNRVLGILDNLISKISPEMPRHILKWKDSSQWIYKSMEEWNSNVEHLRDVIRGRNQVVIQELEAF